MKRLTAIFSVALIMMAATNVNAQKTGYIRVDDVVGLMNINQDSLNSFVTKYLVDSVGPQIEHLQSEYQRKQQQLVDTSIKDVVRKTILAELQDLQQQLEGADAAVNQIRQAKQQEYLEPYYSKAIEAVRDVAKANGYTYVYTKDALLVAPPADDLLPLVAKKLNLKIPDAAKPKPAAAASKK